jgi:O-antigen ligase
MEHYDDSPDRITETFFYPVHNVYLLLTAELGVGAIIAFLILFLLLLIASISGTKSEHPELAALALCACLALVSFGIDGLFEGDAIGSMMFLHFWTAAGLALAVNAERQLRA